MAELTWTEMVRVEPELGHMLKEIRRIKDDKSKPRFCANVCWYCGDPSLKERMCRLVGWDARRREELGTEDAYNLAYMKLYSALPDCRNCLGAHTIIH